MTIAIMLSGTIARQPEQRTSKAGNPSVMTSVRVQTADGDLYASVTAFGDLCPILAGLAKGSPITIAGTARVSTYQGKDGETKAGLSITASRIIALVDQQSPPKAVKPKGNSQPRRFTEYQQPADLREYAADQDLPF